MLLLLYYEAGDDATERLLGCLQRRLAVDV